LFLFSPYRTDLEKAITSHGGPSIVAETLGWKLQAKARKPRGYWDSLENVKQEVDEFIQDNELQPGEKETFYYILPEKRRKPLLEFYLTNLLFRVSFFQKLCL